MDREGEHLHSIEDGVYKRTSVSQIRNFKGCEVSWGFDKIERVERGEPSKGQKVGIQGHDENERFLKYGADVRGEIARAGASMLEPYAATFPFNKGNGLVEVSLSEPTLRTRGGVEFVGYIDYACLIDNVARIVDHKFNKNIKKYPVTVDDLENDEQAIIYGWWGVNHFKTDRAFFELHRYQTEGKRLFEPVGRMFHRDELGDKFLGLSEFVDTRMSPAVKATRARDLKPNTAHCSKYGGCNYERICPYSPRNRFISSVNPDWTPPAADTAPKKKGSSMGLLDVLPGGNAALASNPVVTGAAATPGDGYPPFFARIPASTCKAEGSYGVEGKAATFKIVMEGVAYFIREGRTIQVKPDAMVVDLGGEAHASVAAPKSETPATQATAGGSVTPGDAPASNLGGVGKILKVDDSGLPNAADVAAAKAAAAAEAAQTAAAAAANTTQTPAANTTPATGAPETAEEKKKRGRPAGSKNGIVLLIDCACSSETTDLNRVVADYAKALAAEAKIPDLRLAPKKDGNADHPMAFGGWKAILAMVILKNLPAGMCSISSSELNEPVIEALCGVAQTVIRGSL